MSKSGRLFEIIQILRAADRPLTAQAMADGLEVTKRTVYRDIATLQAMRVPIEGEAGIGYIMRLGYNLPPLMFDAEENGQAARYHLPSRSMRVHWRTVPFMPLTGMRFQNPIPMHDFSVKHYARRTVFQSLTQMPKAQKAPERSCHWQLSITSTRSFWPPGVSCARTSVISGLTGSPGQTV